MRGVPFESKEWRGLGGGAATAEDAARSAALLEALTGVPALPEQLATNPLFATQGIVSDGFGISWEASAERWEGSPPAASPSEAAPSSTSSAGPGAALRLSRLRGAVTRKTVLPTIVHIGKTL